MKSIWKRSTALTLSATLVGACATSPDKIQTAYVSPLAYQNYSCKEIRAELGRVTLRAQELQASLQEKADNDTGKMVIGMVFFWPILFALEGNDPSAQEYARLKGERDTLEQLATQKNCRNITIVDVKPEEPGTQAAAQPAGSMPVQPLESKPVQPAVAPVAAAPAARGKEERLRELKALKDKGLIADEVYDEEQHRILAEPTPPSSPQPAASSVAMAAPAAAPTPAPAAQPAAAGPSGLRPGDRWDYVVIDSRNGGRAQRSFEIEQASQFAILEHIQLEDGKTLSVEHRKGPYLSLSGGMQFAPYYLALQPVVVEGPVGAVRIEGGDACATRELEPGDKGSALECEIQANIAGRDRVTVPAGTFDAVRVHVAIYSQRPLGRARQHIGDGDFWFSPEAGRVIKAAVKYEASRPWTETMELVGMQVAAVQHLPASTSVATATPAAVLASAATPAPAPAPSAAPAPTATPAKAGPGGLRAGNRWDYVVVDSRKSSPARRSFEIEKTSDVTIVERIRLENGKTLSAEHGKGPYLSLSGGMQFAPYYLALQPVTVEGRLRSVRVVGGDACATRETTGGDYASSHECQIEAEIAGTDRVTVPAGTFDAVRVHVTIHSEALRGLRIRQHIGDGDFWVSPKAGRLVKASVQYDASRPWTETMELESTSVALTR